MAIYKEVKEDLNHKISDGIFKSGDKIPSERALSESYGVSRMTIRQALTELENEGFLIRETGRGTFVSAPNLYQENLKSFTQTLIDRHMTPSTEVIEVSKVLHLRHISQMLDIHPDEPYYKIKRLRCGDDVPIALETVYIPMMYAKDIDQYDLTQSLYSLLESNYHYEFIRIASEIEATMPNRGISELMRIKKQTALLKVTGVTFCQNDFKLFYEESYYRSELYKYHVDILGISPLGGK